MLRDFTLTKLCDITRFSQLHFVEPDTDAMHTIRIQLYILCMYNDLGDIIPYKELCYRALVHDLDETVCCDIPRNIKYYSDEAHDLISNITTNLLNESGISNKIIEDINTAKSKDEWSYILKVLDVYDALCTLIKEWKLQGSERIRQCAFESIKHLNHSLDLLKESNLPEIVKSYLINDSKELESEVYV